MTKPNISLSLIIPTIGREADLVRLLKSLCGQSRKDFEVIVVDQSEQPEKVSLLLSGFQNQLAIRHIIHHERGASRARNVGADCAVGEFLGWPDDDCWYESDVVEKVVDKLQKQTTSILLGCPLTEEGKLYNRWIPREPRKVQIQDILSFGIEWSIFMRTYLFTEVGRFDPLVGPGAGTVWPAGESVDLCFRAGKIDTRLAYLPTIRIHHPSSRSESHDADQKAFKYAYGMGAMIRKNKLPNIEQLIYIGSYLRAICWALVRLEIADVNHHIYRLKGYFGGYYNYYKDRELLGD